MTELMIKKWKTLDTAAKCMIKFERKRSRVKIFDGFKRNKKLFTT
jgi:hypothetical protein